MKTFDKTLPEITKILQQQIGGLTEAGKLIINRDLNGRVRLVVDENIPKSAKDAVNNFAESIAMALGSRVPEKERVIYESHLDEILNDIPCFPLEEFPNVIIADRMLGETNWGTIEPINMEAHRFVFYSIKGGVGRSTALAATAWTLAEEGKKVLILDMDLESPGISSSLLSKEKSPMYGIVDWLVEDLVDNGDQVFPYIASPSDLSRNGEIYVVPAYGKEPGEYISKIGRAWMSKPMPKNHRELWHYRLKRLLQKLESQIKPDVILIDSRAGIDEISSACITCFGAESVLLFSIDSEQTWDGYKILFDHWLKTGTFKNIRERLQIIGALIPETNQKEYIDSLCENSWDLFTGTLYDRLPPGESGIDLLNFDKDDVEAPHYPKIVRWNRGFEALSNLYHPLGQQLIQEQVKIIFGDMIDYIRGIIKDG